MKTKLPVIFLLGMMTGCSMTPDYQKPDMAFGNEWQGGNSVADTESYKTWLAGYGDAALQGLLEKARVNNADMAAAAARVKQARASVESTRAESKPTLNASAGVSRDVVNPVSGKTDSSSSGNALLSASYELDVWGKLQAGVISKEEKLAVAQYAHQSAWLTVSSEAASLYTEYRLIEKKIGIAVDVLSNFKELEDLANLLVKEGKADKSELLSARINTENAQSNLENLKKQGKIIRYALAVSAGEAPQDFVVPEIKNSVFIVPAISPFQPSDLLTRRPDIASAEAELKAANADIGAARAAFYPTVNLSASGGAALAAGFSNPAAQTLSLGAGILAPIFSAGSLNANLEIATAGQEELAAMYKQTVLTAFADTETALAELDNSRRNHEYVLSIERERLAMLELDKQRYKAGRIDKAEYLRSENAYMQSRLDKADADTAYRNAVLSVYKAMGGEGN